MELKTRLMWDSFSCVPFMFQMAFKERRLSSIVMISCKRLGARLVSWAFCYLHSPSFPRLLTNSFCLEHEKSQSAFKRCSVLLRRNEIKLQEIPPMHAASYSIQIGNLHPKAGGKCLGILMAKKWIRYKREHWLARFITCGDRERKKGFLIHNSCSRKFSLFKSLLS